MPGQNHSQSTQQRKKQWAQFHVYELVLLPQIKETASSLDAVAKLSRVYTEATPERHFQNWYLLSVRMTVYGKVGKARRVSLCDTPP